MDDKQRPVMKSKGLWVGLAIMMIAWLTLFNLWFLLR